MAHYQDMALLHLSGQLAFAPFHQKQKWIFHKQKHCHAANSEDYP